MSKFRETPAWEQLKNISSKTFPLTAKPFLASANKWTVWRSMKHSRKGLAGEFLDWASVMELSRLLGSVKLESW